MASPEPVFGITRQLLFLLEAQMAEIECRASIVVIQSFYRPGSGSSTRILTGCCGSGHSSGCYCLPYATLLRAVCMEEAYACAACG